MQNLLSRLTTSKYIDLPFGVAGWLGWLLLLAIFAFALWKNWEALQVRRLPRVAVFLVLALATPFAAWGLGIILGDGATLPYMPVEPNPPALMFFAALPWVLAAGGLGTISAALLGVLSGICLALSETHSLYTPLQVGFLALLFATAVRQRYRTRFYQALRHPVIAALVVVLPFLAMVVFSSIFEVTGEPAVRLDYGITRTWPFVLARCLELLLAAVVGEAMLLLRSRYWRRPAILLPSPSESSLQARFAMTTLPLLLLLAFGMIIGDWLVAGNAARSMLRNQLSSTATVAADSLPYFMEAG